MKNLLDFNSTIILLIVITIFAPCLKAQDTLNFYSDTTVVCSNINDPEISCNFKPGPGNEGYECLYPSQHMGNPLITPVFTTGVEGQMRTNPDLSRKGCYSELGPPPRRHWYRS